MAKKKDMAGDYEILHSIRLGGRLMLMVYDLLPAAQFAG